jgi:hypothetical protein
VRRQDEDLRRPAGKDGALRAGGGLQRSDDEEGSGSEDDSDAEGSSSEDGDGGLEVSFGNSKADDDDAGDDSEDESEGESEDEDGGAGDADLRDVPFGVLQELRKDGSHDRPRNKAARGGKGAGVGAGADKRNKDAPVEASSKVPVGRARQVVHVAQRKGRDPRFEESAGAFNKALFDKT